MTKRVKFDLLTKQLLGDNVLVEAVDVDTDSIIATPKQYQDKPELGIVLATGPGHRTENYHVTGTMDGILNPPPIYTSMSVQKDDVVLFNKYLATKFRIDGIDYYVVKEEDIVAYGKQD